MVLNLVLFSKSTKISTGQKCVTLQYPGVTGSNPVEEMGTFFLHAASSIFRLSLTHTHAHTHTHTHTRNRQHGGRVSHRVRSGYGKSGKSMEFVFSISRPGKSMEICEKLWKLQRFGTFCLLPEKLLKTESVPPARALGSCCHAFDRKQFEG